MPTIFAQSPLWELQRRYFEEAQVNAWREGDVPHYISSNPHMAQTYAQTILGVIRDTRATAQAPLYIVELGAGSGRFSYHLLKALSNLMAAMRVKKPPVVYVMTDFVEDTVAYWQNHLRLQQFAAQGILDFALFDAEKDSTLELRLANKTIAPKSLKNPLVVVANYFFDSIPQELYRFDQGKAQQVLIDLKFDSTAGSSAKAQLEAMVPKYSYQEIDTTAFEQPALQKIFSHYQHNLHNSHLLFPTIGMQCLERLKVLSEEGLVVLSADKGKHRLEDWHGKPAPHIAKHGSFSLSVNYHALGEHCKQLGGQPLFPMMPTERITVAALLYVPQPQKYVETIAAYCTHVIDFGPDDYFCIKKHIEQQVADLSRRDISVYLRLSNYDSRLFSQFLPRLWELAPELHLHERLSLLQLVSLVWDGYYPMGEKLDLAHEIGGLLLQLGFPQEALQFFDYSEQLYGSKEAVQYARAMGYFMLEQKAPAQKILTQLIAQNPDHTAAQKLLREVAKVARV